MTRYKAEDPVDRWIRHRPLALFALCFLAGVIIGRLAPPRPLLWAAGCAAALVLFAVFRKKAFLFSLALLLGALRIAPVLADPPPLDVRGAELSGRVASEVSVTETASRVLFREATLNGEACPDILVYFYEDAPSLAYGDRVTVTASVRSPKTAGNPGGFDYAAWLRRRGAAYSASVSTAGDVLIERDTSLSPMRAVIALRQRLAAVIGSLYGEGCRELALALVIGDKSEMPAEIRGAFQKAGVSHLLALSGLHVTVLFVCVEWIFRKLRVKKTVAFALCLVLMGTYALLVGLPASILRAALMYALLRTARFMGRPCDALTRLCTALLILLLIDPLYIEDAGFVLSFSAVGGLILFSENRAPRSFVPTRLPRPAADALFRLRRAAWSCVAAQLGTIPAMACLFNRLPVWFLPFNIVLIPLMTLLFPALILSVLLGCVFLPLGQAAAWVVSWPLRLLARIAAESAALPFSLVRCADWPWPLIVLYAAAALAASPYFPARRFKHRRLCAALLMVVLIGVSAALPALKNTMHTGLDITFLDVGQGDAAVIHADDKYYLVDAGEDSTAADYLTAQGIAPNGVFLSHGHADHAGGLAELVESLPPCPLYVSASWEEEIHDAVVDEAFADALDAGWPVYHLGTGDLLALSDSVSAKVWNAGGEASASANENCMVLSVSLGKSTALFTGDLPMALEWMPLPDCTVLKIPHHGSATSTGRLMLAQTTPAAAVISVGRNTYGHPAQAVLDRLAGIAVYRTDSQGAITVRMTENGDTHVSTWRAKEDT